MPVAPYLVRIAIFRNVPKGLGRLWDTMKLILGEWQFALRESHFGFCCERGKAVQICFSLSKYPVLQFLPLKYTMCIGFCFFLCCKLHWAPTAAGERAACPGCPPMAGVDGWWWGGSVPLRGGVGGRQRRKGYLVLEQAEGSNLLLN